MLRVGLSTGTREQRLEVGEGSRTSQRTGGTKAGGESVPGFREELQGGQGGGSETGEGSW